MDNHNVDLTHIQTAVDMLQKKYPQISFGSDFEPAINGQRGIFDVNITVEKYGKDELTILSMIVPRENAKPNSSQADFYMQHIERFMREYGIIT